MNKKLNIVFIGDMSYPEGMASTKRVRNIIESLKKFNPIINVIVIRQQNVENSNGTYKNHKYYIVAPNKTILQAILIFPIIIFKLIFQIFKLKQYDCKNIIYKYESPSIFDTIPVIFAKIIGYKIIYDIVEDVNFAYSSTNNLIHRIKITIAILLTNMMHLWTDAILYISNNLGIKFQKFNVKYLKKLYYQPISIDFKIFEKEIKVNRNEIVLFYGGSFGSKDCVENLIYAFNNVAEKKYNVKLKLSGKGDKYQENFIFNIIKKSKHQERIHFLGYLDDDKYLYELKSSDILCMIRSNSGYSNAGFPFKLGEYLATGKPVIATKVSDIPLLFTDKKEIYLIEANSVDLLESNIEFIINNYQKSAKIGNLGKKKARTLFDIENQGYKLFNFLRDL